MLFDEYTPTKEMFATDRVGRIFSIEYPDHPRPTRKGVILFPPAIVHDRIIERWFAEIPGLWEHEINFAIGADIVKIRDDKNDQSDEQIIEHLLKIMLEEWNQEKLRQYDEEHNEE